MSEKKTACEVGLNKEGKPACRECAMGMLVSWQIDELKKRGFSEQAQTIEDAALNEGLGPSEICKVMDKVYQELPAEAQQRMNELNLTFDGLAEDQEEEA